MNMNFFKQIGSAFGNVASPLGMKGIDGTIVAYSAASSGALLTNANATINGTAIAVSENLYHTVQVAASSSSGSGATIQIQASLDSTTWTALGSTTITSVTNQLSTFTGKYAYIRGAITAYNNGSYSAKVVSGN